MAYLYWITAQKRIFYIYIYFSTYLLAKVVLVGKDMVKELEGQT